MYIIYSAIGSSVFYFTFLFYSLRFVFFFFRLFIHSLRLVWIFFLIVFARLRSYNGFNKLWVMESSPHVVECRRMLNAAAATTAATVTTVMCGVVVYLYIIIHSSNVYLPLFYYRVFCYWIVELCREYISIFFNVLFFIFWRLNTYNIIVAFASPALLHRIVFMTRIEY
jgi:hypothetical protein